MIPQAFQIDSFVENVATPQKSFKSDQRNTGEPFSAIFQNALNPEQTPANEAPLSQSWTKAIKAAANRLASMNRTNLPPGQQENLKKNLFGKNGKLNLELLKKLLSGKGGKLGDLSVNREGLLALKQFLLANGLDHLDQGKIDELFKGLESKTVTGKISLKDLFAQLKASGLTEEEDDDEKDPLMLEISALPYLESILAGLQVKPEDVKTILADAKTEGVGIDLTRLIKNLKHYMAHNQTGSQSRAQDQVMQNDALHKHLQQMFNRLGLGEDIQAHSPLSLDRLVAELEKLKNRHPVKNAVVASGTDKMDSAVLDESSSIPNRLMAELDNAQGTGTAKTDTLLRGTDTIDPLLRNGSSSALDRLATAVGHTKGSGTAQKDTPLKGAPKLDHFLANVQEMSSGQTHAAKTGTVESTQLLRQSGLDKHLFTMQDHSDAKTKSRIKDKMNKTDLHKQVVKAVVQGAHDAPTEVQDSAKGKSATSGLSLKQQGAQTKTKNESPAMFETIFKGTDHREQVAAFGNSRPTTKSLPAYLINQVNRQVARSIVNNESEVSLHLKPPHLGRLKMTITNHQGALRVNILAEQHTTRDMLMNHSHDLKQVLADHGVRLEKVDVQISYNFDQSMSQAKQEAFQQRGRKKRHTEFLDDQAVNERGSPELPEQRPLSNLNGLDLVA